MRVLVRPALRFAVHETGEIEHLSPWFPFVAFDRDFLDRADGRRVTVRGGTVEFHCTNGRAVYLLEPDVGQDPRAGRLLDTWGD